MFSELMWVHLRPFSSSLQEETTCRLEPTFSFVTTIEVTSHQAMHCTLTEYCVQLKFNFNANSFESFSRTPWALSSSLLNLSSQSISSYDFLQLCSVWLLSFYRGNKIWNLTTLLSWNGCLRIPFFFFTSIFSLHCVVEQNRQVLHKKSNTILFLNKKICYDINFSSILSFVKPTTFKYACIYSAFAYISGFLYIHAYFCIAWSVLFI